MAKGPVPFSTQRGVPCLPSMGIKASGIRDAMTQASPLQQEREERQAYEEYVKLTGHLPSQMKPRKRRRRR